MAAPNPVPEADEDVDVAASGFEGLAVSWESHKDIRHSARSRGALLDWGSAAVGIPSMTLGSKLSLGPTSSIQFIM